MQLETITEFVEHHTADDVGGFYSSILSETILSIAKLKTTLRAWPIMIALLLREGDDVGATTALSDAQCSILLRIFAHSASALRASMEQQAETSASSSVLQKVGAKRPLQSTTKDDGDLDELSAQLVSNLPRLLVRFRDDEDNLVVLGDLLPCCDISSTDLHQKSMKLILTTISGIMGSSQNEALIQKFSVSLRHWIKLGGRSLSQVRQFRKFLAVLFIVYVLLSYIRSNLLPVISSRLQ
jgi:hypothetical protein